jgi:hypothetical protein
MLDLRINDGKGARNCRAEVARDQRQTSFHFVAVSQIAQWFGNTFFEYAFESHFNVERFKLVSTLLQSLGSGNVAQLSHDA